MNRRSGVSESDFERLCRVSLKASDVMDVIRSYGPSFRNPFDKIAFALHASFISSGYTLTATGEPAYGNYLPPSDSVRIEGWNNKEKIYAFDYSKLKKIVCVVCLVSGDCLKIFATGRRDGKSIDQHVTINVEDYTKKAGPSEKPKPNFDDEYKNFNKLVKTLNSNILCKMEDSPDAGPSLWTKRECDEAAHVMGVIQSHNPPFRNPFDMITFALHASFISSKYTLSATGEPADECGLPYAPPAEVGIEGWNDGEDVYAFVYSKVEINFTKIVRVKCFVNKDDLEIITTRRSKIGIICQNVKINVEDYTEKASSSTSSNFVGVYKDFVKLVKKLNSDILSEIEDSPKKEESLKKDGGTSSWGAHAVYHDPTRTEQKELEPHGTD